jgi:hypothetical protein
MSAPTLPVDLQWVAHTLMPYLRYAFQHVLHRNLDITPYIQRVLDSSTSKSVGYLVPALVPAAIGELIWARAPTLMVMTSSSSVSSSQSSVATKTFRPSLMISRKT